MVKTFGTDTLLLARVTGMQGRRQLTPSQIRFVSSELSRTAPPKQVSPHIGFYKTFGRPVAKVLLMATFTYQLSYWLWVKLEKDETKLNRQAEIAALESNLQDTIAKTKIL